MNKESEARRKARLEEEQRKARAHFAANLDTIINATGVGMWDWDLQAGKIVHSGQLERIAGYEDGEMPDADVSARDLLIYSADRKRADEIIAACVAGQLTSYETEFRITCKNGEIKWVQDRGAVAEWDENGNARRIVGMFYDVNRFKKTEEALAEKLRLLDVATAMNGLGTLDWDLTTNRMRYDEDFLNMFGYTETEVADSFEKLLHFMSAEDFEALGAGLQALLAMDRAAQETEVFSLQMRGRHKNGQLLWVNVTARVAAWDADERPIRVYAGVLNVDKLVRAELEAQKALQENIRHKQQLEVKIETAEKDLEQMRRTSVAMFDASPHMSLIFDDKYRAVDCNPAMMAYFGFNDKQAMLEQIVPILMRAIPERQPNGKPSFSMMQRLEATLKDGITEFETWFDFDGRMVPMNIIMKRIDYMGSFAIAAYQVDLTTIKKTENRLRRQDVLLKAANEVAALLMESQAGQFMQTLDETLRVLGENLGADRAYVWQNYEEDSRLYATQLCEWVDKAKADHHEYGERKFCYDELLPNWRDIITGDGGINTPMAEMGGALSTFPGLADVKSVLLIPLLVQGDFWGFLGFDDCHSDVRVFSSSEERIMRSAGTLIAAAALRNEMTENLMAAKEAALAGSRAKSDFLSRMSHEIRTPLNAIIGMSAIAHKSHDMEKMQYCLEKVDTASRQLLDLINDILDMSKIEANKLEISANEFDFERMVQNIVHVVNVKMEEKALELNFDFRDMFKRKVVCDELRLSQVLINLLNNAAKFTPEGGQVHVKMGHTTAADGRARLSVVVRDNGIGISPEEQRRLFTAFEQADGGTTRKYGGTGLGLAICQSIVRMMGGDIWVESAPGKGSAFSFEVDFAWGGPLDALPPPPEKRDDLRVLVVDDSTDVLDYFTGLLEGFSAVCHTACSGQQAIEQVKVAEAEGRPYDVAFIDWKMPEMDGRQTAGALQKLAGNTRLVMISVADQTDVVRDVAGLGITHFLPKPVLPSTLFNTLVDITGRHYVAQAQAPAEHSYHWHGKKLLLVEDIEINREIILSLLDDTGLEIECASDGLEAVEVFRQRGHEYDLVLMDVQMPRMDGLQATRHIRAGGAVGGQVPIIAMTANAFKEDVERCLDAGMNDHVAKPIDMDDLYRTLQRFLGASPVKA